MLLGCLPGHIVIHQLLLIDSAVECLADALIIERFLLGVKEQEWQVEAILFFNRHASALKQGSVISRYVFNNVRCAGLTSVGTCSVIYQNVPNYLGVLRFLFTVVILIRYCNNL